MGKRHDPEVVAAVMRLAGYEPLVPYPGAGQKWKCLCSKCGETREPRYSDVVRGVGCGSCARNESFDPQEAAALMRESGLEPLGPYPGSANEPWPSRCAAKGHEVSPRLSTVKARGSGCRFCSNARRIDDSEAKAAMRQGGWEPLVGYPGATTPWKSRCKKCKSVRTPTLVSVRKGHGCAVCKGIGPLDPTIAEARMLAAGARPLVPFVGVDVKWECECLKCHQTVHPRLSQVTAGFGVCAHCAGNARFQHEAAAAFMEEAGFRPLVPYPGSSKKWECLCLRCETVRTPTLNQIRSVKGGCGNCAGLDRLSHEDAAAVMRAASLEPLVPYPGAGDPWLCRCLGCKGLTSPTYSNIARNGSGCMTCRMRLDLPGRTAGMYLLVHEGLGAVKFGIGALRGELFPRVQAHVWRGWVEVARWTGFGDVRVVMEVERLVLERWKAEGVAGFVPRSAMPQGGWSETAPLARVNVEDLVGMVTARIGDVADRLPSEEDLVEGQSA